ncbi:MAG: YidC/Oxa1 family insertase periplasmic-domain containing protein [Brevinematia bacterium]
MSREARLFLFLVLWLGLVFAFTILFPPQHQNSVTKSTNLTQNEFASEKKDVYSTVAKEYFSILVETNSLRLLVSESGVDDIYFYYGDRYYELASSNYVFKPLSVVLGSVVYSTNLDKKYIYFDRKGVSEVKINNNNLSIFREIIFVSNYTFDVVVKVKNKGSKPVIFDGISLVFSGPLGPDTSDERFSYIYLRTGYIEKGSFNFVETLTTSIFSGTERHAVKDYNIISGIWMENKYTVLGIVALEGECRAEFVALDTKYGINKIMALKTLTYVFEGGSEKIYKFRVFVGPRKNEVLEFFGYGFKNLEDGGILKPIYDFLKLLIKLFYNLTGSWGLAVVLIAIAVKVLLEPLSIKSAISMKRLQIISPKIKEIQEKYKNDPKKMNAEIAELYRIYGANPASGCLPLLLQIPIFIALYNVLSGFIELKGQELLWIKDLTKPDTIIYIKELEGLFLIPASINLLPIIMTSISLVQTYLMSSKSGATQQNVTMWILPIVFMFIFWNLPSALVLYWTIQTLLGTVEQYVINKVLKY